MVIATTRKFDTKSAFYIGEDDYFAVLAFQEM